MKLNTVSTANYRPRVNSQKPAFSGLITERTMNTREFRDRANYLQNRSRAWINEGIDLKREYVELSRFYNRNRDQFDRLENGSSSEKSIIREAHTYLGDANASLRCLLD